MTDVPWTPGPWTFYAPTSWTDGLGYIRPKLEDGREIAHHGDTLRAPAENMANARLIAEAPAMAEALEELARLVEASAFNKGQSPHKGSRKGADAYWDAARKAKAILARIKGAAQ